MRTIALIASLLAFASACTQKPSIEQSNVEPPSSAQPRAQAATAEHASAELLCPRTEYWIDVWTSRQAYLVAKAPGDMPAALINDDRTSKFKFRCQEVALPPDPDGPAPKDVRASLLGVDLGTVTVVDASGDNEIPYNKDQGARCSTQSDCNRNSYCNQRPGTCQSPGQCQIEPAADRCEKKIDPVIGCDNQKYNNACLAAAKGVSIKEKIGGGTAPNEDAPKE